MDARMVYRTFPTLKQAALLRTVTLLWNQDDIKTSLVKLDYPNIFDFDRSEWREMEDRVTRRALELPLPKSLKELLPGLIQPIGRRIFKWVKDPDHTCMRITVPEFSWTAQGTIDEKKTVELLIKDKNLDILTRYELACINCLEDDIAELWKEIRKSHNSALCRLMTSEVTGNKLVAFWTYSIRGKVDKIFENSMHTRPYQRAFQYAAHNGCKAATEYFLQKLTSVEREECLVNVAAGVAMNNVISVINSKNFSDILCFLLSQMSEEQQAEVFKARPDEVLRCLLDWPWQEFFMETAQRLWNFLCIYGFVRVLEKLVDKVGSGSVDYNYQYLFGEFWRQSPAAHKEYVTGQLGGERHSFLLSALFRVKDRENIKLVLKDTSTVVREDLIFSEVGKSICSTLIDEGERDLLKFFLQQCMPSKDTLIKFKEKVRERVEDTAIAIRLMDMNSYEKRLAEKNNHMFIKLAEILPDLIREYDKKKPAEKGDCNPCKKLCI